MSKKAEDLFVIRPTNNEQNEYIITVGKLLATTKKFKNQEEAEKYIKYPKWDTAFALFAEMLSAHEEASKVEEEIKKDAKNVVKSIINNTIKK